MPDEQTQQPPPSIQQEPASNQVADPIPVQQQPSQPLTEQNTSGTGSAGTIPPGVAGWSWGAFFLTWIWGIGNSVWIALLALVPIPLLSFIMSIVLGIRGRELAWRAKHWDSVDSFNKTQHNWSIAGVLLFSVSLLLIPILVVIVIVAINPAGRIKEADLTRAKTEVLQVGTAISGCITDQTAKGAPADQVYSQLAWDPATKRGGCADPTTLQYNYIRTIPSGVTIIFGPNKICAYKATSNEPIQYASWNSDQRQVLTVPNGTNTCN